MVWNLLGVRIANPEQVVLEADPPRRLLLTRGTPSPPSWHERAEVSEDVFAAAAGEPRSKVTFELEPAGSAVKLTVVHDGSRRFEHRGLPRHPTAGRGPLATQDPAGDRRHVPDRQPNDTPGRTDRRGHHEPHLRSWTREEWRAARELAARAREGAHPPLPTSWPALGASRPGCASTRTYALQTAGWAQDPGRAVRRPLPAGHLPLHVRGLDYDHGCPVCSSIADSFNGVLETPEGPRRDDARVSQAPVEKLVAEKERLGWSFRPGTPASRATSTPTSSIRSPASRRAHGSPTRRRSSRRTPRIAGLTRPATWPSGRA